MLEESIATFEAAYRAQRGALADAHRDGLSQVIVAFEMQGTRDKLSQTPSTADQARIASQRATSPDTEVAAGGDAMRDRPRA
ncbi:hypothetical protein CMK11_11675 [Candidatus Poribacteria bacterium]|nr:hypothetical protein [Candidatus Poribacteria bacterium]